MNLWIVRDILEFIDSMKIRNDFEEALKIEYKLLQCTSSELA